MIDRLQFRHHNEVFNSRKEAIEYITTGVGYSLSSVTSGMDVMQASSLFAEPTILAYKNEDDSTNPHVILAIGSRTNPGINSELVQWDDNRFCIIDIDEVKDIIDEHYDEFITAVKALTLIPKNTDTLNLYAASSETGTFISGDVKTEDRFVFSEDSVSVKNNLMVTENGLFMYVNLKYDEENEQFTFSVSNADKTLSSTTITLPNNYLTGGSYDVKDESIHLNLRNGDEVVIDCKNLITEWTVESSASTTPIVLTKERVYDGESELIQPWQDVLRADVRIDTEAEDNILEKSWDGTRLKVDGKASNITCWKNGEKLTVQEALNNLHELKVSNDSRNIIFEKIDGVFSTVNLEYKPNENKLLFTVSGRGISGEPTVTTEEIQLNTISLFKNVWYDSITEELVIEWVDDSGETHYSRISIGQMIEEWEPQNEGHSVEVSRVRNVGGKDKVSADVKIANTQPNNILEDVNHELYVNGTASNIKYNATGTTNVKQVLDNLSANTTFLSGAIDSVSGIVDARFDTIDDEIEELSANTLSSIKNITSIDNSINVTKSVGNDPTVDLSFNISSEKEYDVDNIIKLEADGLYVGVDLDIVSGASGNVLIFKSTNGTKEIPLKTNSTIDKIWYDPTREAIIIEYTVNGQRMPDVVVPVGDLIEEWEVESGHPFAIQLNRKRVGSGSTGHDILSASAITSSDSDNILIIKDNALKVSNVDIVANANAITQEIQDRINDVNAEETRAINAETTLNNKINNEETRAKSQENIISGLVVTETATARQKEDELRTAINNEVTRATNAETALQTVINNEKTRAMSAETALSNALATTNTRLDNEITARTNADDALQDAIDAEEARAKAVEEALSDRIDSTTIAFNDTNTIDFTQVTASTGSIITADVKVPTLDNIITIDQGIKAKVDLRYDSGRNVLIFGKSTSTGTGYMESEIALNAGSIIDSINYDSNTKELVITYHTSSSPTPIETRVNVSSLFNEWICDSNHVGGIILTKSLGTGTGGADVLSAEVQISTRGNNLLVNDGGTLFVEGSGITANANAITNLRSDLTSEINRSIAEDTRLNNALIAETNARISSDSSLRTDLTAEVNRAQGAETALQTAINNEVTRAQNVESELRTAITTEVTNRTTDVGRIETALSNEVTARTAADTELQTLINNEINRATTAETNLYNMITAETANRISSDNNLDSRIDALNGQVTANTTNIEALSGRVNTNTTNITNLTSRVSTNETNISNLQTFSGNAANSRLTIQKNGVTVATYTPTASTTANIEVPTSLSQLTNNLNKLTWSLGTPTADTAGYNGSDGKNITIPSELNHLNASSIKTLTITTNDGTTTTTAGTYNPTSDATINIAIPSLGNLKALTWTNGAANTGTYNGSANTTLNVPSSMQHLSEYNSGVYTIAGAINLSGNLTASSVYSTSDVNLKENIAIVSVDKKFLANHIEIKEFNLKNDPNKTKVYGVIAQEVEAAGLNEVVITKEDGYKAVDYTSLMMLKIAYLEKENKHLKDKLSEIEERLKKLEK